MSAATVDKHAIIEKCSLITVFATDVLCRRTDGRFHPLHVNARGFHRLQGLHLPSGHREIIARRRRIKLVIPRTIDVLAVNDDLACFGHCGFQVFIGKLQGAGKCQGLGEGVGGDAMFITPGIFAHVGCQFAVVGHADVDQIPDRLGDDHAVIVR